MIKLFVLNLFILLMAVTILNADATSFNPLNPDMNLYTATKTIQNTVVGFIQDGMESDTVVIPDSQNYLLQNIMIPHGDGGLKVSQQLENPVLTGASAADTAVGSGTYLFETDKTYYWAVVYYSATHGETSLYSGTIISDSSPGDSIYFILSDIPTPSDNKVTHKYLFRSDSTYASADTLYYVASLALTATTYADSETPDTGLGYLYVASTTSDLDKYNDNYIVYENCNQAIDKRGTMSQGLPYFLGAGDILEADDDKIGMQGVLNLQAGAICMTRNNFKSDSFTVPSGYTYFMGNILNDGPSKSLYAIQPNILGASGSATLTETTGGAVEYMDAGTYAYKMIGYSTELNLFASIGAETSINVADDTGYVSLSSLDTVSNVFVNQRWILRTTAGGSDYLLLYVLNDNTTTTYTDQTNDTELTAYNNEENQVQMLQGYSGMQVHRIISMNQNNMKFFDAGTIIYGDNDNIVANGYLFLSN